MTVALGQAVQDHAGEVVLRHLPFNSVPWLRWFAVGFGLRMPGSPGQFPSADLSTLRGALH
jgi:hypothetical protein